MQARSKRRRPSCSSRTLDEEAETDRKLTEIAESVNANAEHAAAAG
jgi:hypothetical protein